MKTLYKIAEELDKSGEHHASDVAMQVYIQFKKMVLNKLYLYCLNDSVATAYLIYILSYPSNLTKRVNKLLSNAIGFKKIEYELWFDKLEEAVEIIFNSFKGFKSFSDRVCNMVNAKSKEKIDKQTCLSQVMRIVSNRKSQGVEYAADDYAISQEILKEFDKDKVREVYDGDLANSAN